MHSSTKGPAYQSMEGNEPNNACETADYIANMTKIFAVTGMCLGGSLCFVPAAACCTTIDNYEDENGNFEEIHEPTSVGECFQVAGKVMGAPTGIVGAALGCVVATLTTPCVGLFGQPKAVKKNGDDATEIIQRGITNCC